LPSAIRKIFDDHPILSVFIRGKFFDVPRFFSASPRLRGEILVSIFNFGNSGDFGNFFLLPSSQPQRKLLSRNRASP